MTTEYIVEVVALDGIAVREHTYVAKTELEGTVNLAENARRFTREEAQAYCAERNAECPSWEEYVVVEFDA